MRPLEKQATHLEQSLSVRLGSLDNAVEQEEEMVVQDQSASGEAAQPKAGKLELSEKREAKTNGHGESGITVQPDTKEGEIELAGFNPMPSDGLEVYAMYFNNRPITASHLHIASYALPGHRPIFASELAVREDLTLPGGRPVMISDPQLMESSGLPGGRPIASNSIGDGEPLMGFLD